MQQPSIAAGIVAGLLTFAAAHGADADGLARQAGIAPETLHDPDARLPFGKYRIVMGLAQEATGKTGLALHFGAEIGMAQLSILGLIMEASATMGEALAQMQRYGRLAVALDPSAPARFGLEQRQGRLFLVDHRPDADLFPELTEEAFAQLTCGPRRFLERPHVLSVHLTYPPPAHAGDYERVFACPVHFNAAFNALELHPDTASWPVAQSPRYVFGVLRERADQLLAAQEVPVGYRGQLEAMLRPVLHQGEPEADAMAGLLGCSRSTLFRRLREEGTSYRLVLDALRRDMAVSYLRGGRTSVGEIAYLVGFSDPVAFSRAFRRWTGETPGRYRSRGVAGPDTDKI